jgi:hypothetical protein
MKKDLLTVKDLAAELHMSPKSIQRAYRKEEIPVQWLGRMARFDLTQVRRAMERNGRSRMRCLNGNRKFLSMNLAFELLFSERDHTCLG